MPKKKLLKKPSVARTAIKSAKSGSSKKSRVINYLSPINEITQCIEHDYSQLKKLLTTTPEKITKAIATAKTRHKKATQALAKIFTLLTQAKKKPKVKATKNSRDIAKREKSFNEAKVLTSALDTELQQLQEQLGTCQAMKREYITIEKAVKIVKSDLKKPSGTQVKKVGKSKKKLKQNNAPAKNSMVKALESMNETTFMTSAPSAKEFVTGELE